MEFANDEFLLVFKNGQLLTRRQDESEDTTQDQINTIKEDVCCQGNAVIDHVVNLYSYNTSSALNLSIISVHLVMFVVIVLSIFFDKKSDLKPINKKVPKS